VFAPSLTGLADRRHLFSADVSLATHVDDIAHLIEIEELDGCVLVGHSYGGNVLTGVGDRLRRRVAHYVYFDAVVPPDDVIEWRWSDANTPAERALREHAIATAGAGRALPPPPAATFGIHDPVLLDRVGRKLTPMPAATYQRAIRLTQGGTRGMCRTYLAAVDPICMPMRAMHERLRQAPGWRFDEVVGGHAAMLTQPQALTKRLLAAALRPQSPFPSL
jgi:pimeloyl-ACP methyl ester carboxylesterase